jgi:putative transposase
MAPHGAHPVSQAGPRAGTACPSSALDTQEKAAFGKLVLTYLDESGFSPICPVSYSWIQIGERRRVPFENSEGRRLNLLAALDKDGPAPGIYWVNKAKSFLAEEFLRFLSELPKVDLPRVVMVDNGSLHRNSIAKTAMPSLWARRIYLYYLPPYSPELNDIEPYFRNLKHHEMPKRSYKSLGDLKEAVDRGSPRWKRDSSRRCLPEPGLAAEAQPRQPRCEDAGIQDG